MFKRRSKTQDPFWLPLSTRLKRKFYYPFQRLFFRTIRESTDHKLLGLKKKLRQEPTNAALHYELAKEFYSEYNWDYNNRKKAEYHLHIVFTLDVESQPYFKIIDEHTSFGSPITILEPKEHVVDQKMILDGFSFYSFLLSELGEYLIVGSKVNIVFDMRNVNYLGDLGDGLLLDLQRKAQEKSGDLKCIKVNEEIRDVGEMMEWPKVFGFYESVSEALRFFDEKYKN